MLGTNVKDQTQKRKQKTLLLAMSVVFLMGALSYASVPLYKLFCQVTGYGGTTQVVKNTSDKVLDRSIIVRFDANVNPALDWKFSPTQRSMELSLGENALAFYNKGLKGLLHKIYLDHTNQNEFYCKTQHPFLKA